MQVGLFFHFLDLLLMESCKIESKQGLCGWVISWKGRRQLT